MKGLKGNSDHFLLRFHHVRYCCKQNGTVGVDTVGIKGLQNKKINKKKKDREKSTRRNGEEWSRAYKHKRHGNT